MDYLPYFLIALLLLVIGMQLRVLWAARRQRGRAAPDYSAVVPSGEPRDGRLLFYFHSPHCGPCRALTPMIERLADARPGIVKVDVAEQPSLAREFGVRATPSFVLVERGTIAQMLVGPVTQARIERLLEG
jgi:thioredoxin 1